MEHLHTTICALATPPGEGGIATVRVSGPDAYGIVGKIFVPVRQGRRVADAKGYTAMLGHYLLRGEEMEQFVRESGMTMLADEVRLIDDSFYVIGRKDYENAGDGTARRKSLGELMAGIDMDRLVISLEHEPRFLRQNADAGVDVMLCGHTHDGQFFPLNIAIRTAWENPAGLKTVGRMTSVVTSGVGVYGPDMRIGTDADISVVDIQFAP